MSESTTFDLPIAGMTCASCAGRVERALSKVTGASAVSVNLATELARVQAPEGSLPALMQAVEQAGYSVPVQTLELNIDGMTCASCVGRVERALGKVDGVNRVSVNLANERAHLELLGQVEPQTLIDAVKRAGYDATVWQAEQPADTQANRLNRERLVLVLAILLSIPLVLPMLLQPFGVHWMLPAWVQFALATPVQFIFGARFYVAAFKAVRAGAGHDRRGRRQAQGAGAGDHQHGDGVDQRGFQRRTVQPPTNQRRQGQHQHHRYEDLADFIHQFLNRGLGGLGIFYQADDARQDGFGTQGQRAYQQPAFAVDGTASDFVAGLFGHRQAFAADQRFVGVALTFQHFAVHREAFAGLDQDQVIQAQGADGNVPLLTIDHLDRPLRAQGFEGADGAGGLPLGATFQVFAEQYQGDHHGRGFEIQVRHATRAGDHPFIKAQAVAGAGAQGHQQVHVPGTGTHGLEGGDVETCTEDELLSLIHI